MNPTRSYAGLDHDEMGGMTPTGKIVRDARAFGLIAMSETCEGWQMHQIEALWEKVDAEWEKVGFRVGSMPPELQARYLAVQNEALARAKAAGWSGEAELAADS